MDKEQIIANAILYVKDELASDSSGHDWWHIYRVAKMAKVIAKAEKADIFISELAALLHDIADEKLNPSKEAGLEKVKHWLIISQVDAATQQRIMEIISTMSYGGGSKAAMATLEGQIVQDADRLDAIGALGIARTFAYSGWKGQLIHDPSIPIREAMTAEEYRNGKSTAINHFYEKLLKLKSLMNTSYAKKLAEQRHNVMLAYLDQFFKEWDAEDADLLS